MLRKTLATMFATVFLISTLFVSPAAASTAVADSAMPGQAHFLISDQFNNRVIAVDRNHQIVWQFGNGSSVAGPQSVVAPNDAQRVGSLTLISGTGAPAGTEPSCPSDCVDSRVLLVNSHGHIVWQYGEAGISGSGPNQLNAPVQATWLPSGHVLITDQGNQRIIEVNMKKKIVWQYGITGVTGTGPNQLNNPNSAELLANGHILISDESNNRVIEVTRNNRIVWSYGNPNDMTILNAPAFASRLPNGDTLISDSANNRIVEVNHMKHVVWMYVTNTGIGSVTDPTPTRAVRLRNGDTLISDQFNHRVIEVTKAKMIVFTQGMIGVSGTGFNQLNAPYDAKVIGDYTGLTPP